MFNLDDDDDDDDDDDGNDDDALGRCTNRSVVSVMPCCS